MSGGAEATRGWEAAPRNRQPPEAPATPPQRQHDALRETLASLDLLTAAALEGASVREITAQLAASSGQAVIVLDGDLATLAAAAPPGHSYPPAAEDTLISPGHFAATSSSEQPAVPAEAAEAELARSILRWNPRHEHLLAAFETAASRRVPLSLPTPPGFSAPECAVAPVCLRGENLGFLVVTRPPEHHDEELELLSLQHAASAFAVALLQERRTAELRATYRKELVEALLVGNAPQAKAAELAVLAGLIPDVAYLVFAVAPAGAAGAAPPAVSSIAHELDATGPGVVAVPRTDHVVVLTPALADSNGAPGGAGLQVTERLAGRFSRQEFAIGASLVADDASALPAADEQAQRALRVVRRLGAFGRVGSYNDLGLHGLLLHVPVGELRRFAGGLLGGLIEYDQAHGRSLVETLRTYLKTGEALRRTAELMYVHPNTVSYRLRRIEELTGLKLSTADDRMLARVALEILGYAFGSTSAD